MDNLPEPLGPYDQQYTPDWVTPDMLAAGRAEQFPYVDQGPEIIARDHAPDPGKIDSALAASGASGADRWSARMNAAKPSAGAAITDRGMTESQTPTRVSAASQSTDFGTPPNSYSEGLRRDAALRQAGQPTVWQPGPGSQSADFGPSMEQKAASMARHPSNINLPKPGIER